jgi:putative ABC transport system substrate-binding protein
VSQFLKCDELISYGPDTTEQFRRAAGYVDRILRERSRSDIPVQAPTKYELVIYLKTPKALWLALSLTSIRRLFGFDGTAGGVPD